MIVENIENNLIWRVKEVTDVYGSTTIYQETIFYSLYIVLKSCVKVHMSLYITRIFRQNNQIYTLVL